MKVLLREARAAGTRGHVTWQARPWVQTAGSQTQVCKQKLAHTRSQRATQKGGTSPGTRRQMDINSMSAVLTTARHMARDQ